MDELEKIVQDAIAEVMDSYNEEVDNVIQSNEEWFQDIVDTGRLLDSKKVNISTEGNTTTGEFTWDPNDPDTGYAYAQAVWSGFFAYNGSKYIPGRHWPERAMKNVDPVEAIASYLQEKGIDAEVVQNNIDQLDD